MASILRTAALRVAPATRSFSISAVARKDLIQELYVSQLKAYKPAPVDKSAAAASVRSFSAPQPPKAPELPSDLAAELAKFDAQEPVLGQSSAATKTTEAAAAAAEAEGGEGVQEYLAFLEKDLPKADKHH